MNAREDTSHVARIWGVALDVVRSLRSPRRYNAWVAITDLFLRPHMFRRHPMYAQDQYHALNMLSRNVVHAEYDINANTHKVRAPMSENNMINGQYQRRHWHSHAKTKKPITPPNWSREVKNAQANFPTPYFCAKQRIPYNNVRNRAKQTIPKNPISTKQEEVKKQTNINPATHTVIG